MNSSSYLLAIISIFITVTAVSDRPIVSPPAKIAGHNGNSLVIRQQVIGTESRITEPVNVTETPSNQITSGDSDMVIHCCDPNSTSITDQQVHSMCDLCTTMCHPGAMDARHDDHLLRMTCRCYPVAQCQHISFVSTKPSSVMDGGANHALDNDGNHYNVPVVYGTFTESELYFYSFLDFSLVSWLIMVISASLNYFSVNIGHSRYFKNLTMSIATLTTTNLITELILQRTEMDFKSSGIYNLLVIINAHGWQLATNCELFNTLKCMGNVSKFNRRISNHTTYFDKFYWFFQLFNIGIIIYYIDIFHQVDDSIISLLHDINILDEKISIKPSILICLIPGLVNIIIYLYLFKYKEIPISSIHPDLLNFYAKRISTRNQMFKITVLMFVVDLVYMLDITMEWDFTVVHILHLLKPCQGILVSYVLLFRPLAPHLYNKLLKRLRRHEESADEVTDSPVYTITTV